MFDIATDIKSDNSEPRNDNSEIFRFFMLSCPEPSRTKGKKWLNSSEKKLGSIHWDARVVGMHWDHWDALGPQSLRAAKGTTLRSGGTSSLPM